MNVILSPMLPSALSFDCPEVPADDRRDSEDCSLDSVEMDDLEPSDDAPMDRRAANTWPVPP
jgi:hypothetical protein